MKRILTLAVVITTIVWSMGIATFVPVASAATLTAGDLIKASGPAVYFYAADGKRYTFPTESTYKTWYSDFSGIKTITDNELAAIDLAGNVVVRAGTNLIKITTVPKVFAVEPNGKLAWVKTEAAAKALYGDMWAKKIVNIPDGFWTNYTNAGKELDGTAYPEGQLVKYAGSSDVYYVNANGTKSKIASDSAFTANKFNWNNVITAPATITMADGAAITAAVATLVDVSQGGGSVAVIPTGTGTLTVALAGDTPAASALAKGANGNFTKFTLTASGAEVKVSKVAITKGGYSGTADVENIKITDANGVSLTSAGSLNSNGAVTLTFSPALVLAAGSTTAYYVKAGYISSAAAGLTASFAVAASTSVTSTAATVSGAFPVQGNAMSSVAVTVGTVQITNQSSTVTNVSPSAGDKGVSFLAFQILAGTTEGITVEALTVEQNGSSSNTDTNNIELWNVTTNKSLGIVPAWNANNKASFSGLNLVLGKGENVRLKVKADIVKGSGETLNGTIYDGGFDVTAKGNSYGFYITAHTDVVTPADTSFSGTAQSIRTGSLAISKSMSTPATGNIAVGDDQTLAVWDFEAKGEEVKVTTLKVGITKVGAAVVVGDLTNCKITDGTGALFAGPVDGAATMTFSDTNILPLGVTKLTLKCKVSDSGADGWSTVSSFTAGITPSTTVVVAKGYTTNDTITASPNATLVAGNTQTVKGAAIAAVTLGLPAVQSVAKGTNDFTWATFSLSAANSGEDVNVTNVSVNSNSGDNLTMDPAFDELKNLEVWCDMTTGASTRNDVYETKVSETLQPPATSPLAVAFTTNVLVKKNAYVNCAVLADLSASATVNHRVSLGVVADSVIGSGALTGTSVTDTPAGVGQKMTTATAGVLTTTLDSSSPKASLVIGGATKQTLAVYRLKADSIENMDLDRIALGDTGSGAGVAVGAFELYSSKRSDGVAITTPIATSGSSSTPAFDITDGTVTVPANGYVLLTVKGDVSLVDGATVTNGLTIIPTMLDGDGNGDTVVDGNEGAIVTGLSSGAQIMGTTGVLTPQTATVYKARPVITVDSSSPSGTLGTGSATLVAVFKIDNSDGLDDVTFGTSNSIKVKFNSNATGADAGTEVTVFKDKNGNILESVTADMDADATAKTVTLAFATNTLTVSAGGSELVKVYADTTGFTAAGNSLQVWMDDGLANSFMWGIASAGTFDTSVVSLRGDLYANALSK